MNIKNKNDRFKKYSPDRYKEKKCPICEKLHKKRGNYCSEICGKSKRPRTESELEKRSIKRKEFLSTPAGIIHQKKMTQAANYAQGKNVDAIVTMADFVVEIPTFNDNSEIDFFENYDKAENW